MKYSEVSKLYRLRNGVLERYYSGKSGNGRQGFTGWRVSDSVIGTHGYVTASIGGVDTVAHRVIACLKYKRDLAFKDKVDHKDNNKLNNHVDNIQIVSNQVNATKDYVYRLPTPTPTGKFAAKISVKHGDVNRVGTFNVSLGNYANGEHHKAITLAIRSVFVLRSSNPLRTQFRDLVGAGQYGYARDIVQEYAKDLPNCTLR